MRCRNARRSSTLALSPRDPAYRGRYEGGPWQRDSAYHQGTTWPWLVGPFVDAWLKVYTDTGRWWELYQLSEKLVDLDDALQTWRHKHVITVERIIGGKRGTGGTEGVAYLRTTLNRRCFPELWSVRTRL